MSADGCWVMWSAEEKRGESQGYRRSGELLTAKAIFNPKRIHRNWETEDGSNFLEIFRVTMRGNTEDAVRPHASDFFNLITKRKFKKNIQKILCYEKLFTCLFRTLHHKDS